MGYIPKPDNISKEDWTDYWDAWNICFEVNYRYQNKFIEEQGYNSTLVPHKLRGIHPAYHDCVEYRPGKFKASNGIEYNTADEMSKDYGTYPMYEKNGICYGTYEVLEKEKYKELIKYPSFNIEWEYKDGQ